MIVLSDCKDAQDELFVEIKEAKKFLTQKGMKFDWSKFQKIFF